jgi:hypothetical protein
MPGGIPRFIPEPNLFGRCMNAYRKPVPKLIETSSMNTNNRPPIRLAVHFWRRIIPFWLFRDAGHGSVEQQIANYRYNRLHRGILPSFILKWIGIAACLMASLQILSDLMGKTMEGSSVHVCMVILCATAGMAFAFSCVAITLLTVCYVFLTRTDN